VTISELCRSKYVEFYDVNVNPQFGRRVIEYHTYFNHIPWLYTKEC